MLTLSRYPFTISIRLAFYKTVANLGLLFLIRLLFELSAQADGNPPPMADQGGSRDF